MKTSKHTQFGTKRDDDEDLAHHGHPLRKELLEVAVGIDAVDEGGGTTGLQQLVQLPGEAAEVRVGRVAQPEDDGRLCTSL